ncbi:hypothetical protein SAMN05444285_1377 [Draconibacterium orientale]|jgi:c-di-AMP phosphodiesterase-like protein|uniref:Uncharacterized protein n=1 Tax=Draconibacterium orientale TaxID=1168034 RepID=X5DLS0_9BACT|nr:hypothetical protein [Draconibacterium orientale]AHW61512.1 hypothetical protein FH5T_02965 [Draconibacterium orientale]SEU03984.1 hypothetical protein SAMN05444285_1377 [Draconibacterium orientale]
MEAYSIIVFCIYIGLLAYIIPSSALSFDLYERKFRLLPNWFKAVALIFTIVALLAILIFRNSIENKNEMVISVFNLALFLVFFSKQKTEDEFSEQVRFKAFAYSFVSFVAMCCALGASRINDSGNRDWSNFIIQAFMGGGLLIATLYFYFTLYKLRKENN